jgi:hypothetical protein
MDKIFAVLLIYLVAACASTGKPVEDLSRFLGKNVEVAKEELGKPSSVVNLQNGTWQYS